MLALNRWIWNSAIACQLRLGVGAIGSIPTWLCFFLAFVILMIARSASLVLGITKPDGRNQRTEGGGFMNSVRRTVSVVLETA